MDNTTYLLTGYISNFRIVTGSAVYASGGFTPPTSPLTAISGTQLLTCQNSTGSITDASSNGYTITANGNAAADAQTPFPANITMPTTDLTAVTNTKLLTANKASSFSSITNGSYHFASNSSKLRVDSSDFNLTSSTAFTVEMWYYLIDAPDSRALMDFGNGNLFQLYKISGNMKVYGLGSGYVIDLGSGACSLNTVSYTHLTLLPIYSV